MQRTTPRRTHSMIAAFIPMLAALAGTQALAADNPPVLVVPAAKVPVHVAVDLPAASKLPQADGWQLVDVDQPAVKVPAQLTRAIAADGTVAADARRLVADVPARKGINGTRRFRLEPAKATPGSFKFADVDDKSLKLSDGDKPVLVYNHGTITGKDVPESDHRRTRACYIHPVWGINGEVLTDDFPKDHYHHHGIFWTWPHVGIDDKHHDLWLGNTIHDRFVGWIHRDTGPVAAVLAVENGWFVEDRKVMIERVWMRTHKVSATTRVLDLEFTWIPVDRPVTLWGAGGKSYGGLTVRFAVKDEKAAAITVPSGRTTADLKEAPLPWVDLTYPFRESAPSGAAIFVHPEHPNYPPTWLTRHYGPQCVGWPGVKAKTFEPGKPIQLNYRVFIHENEMDVDALKCAYEGYVAAAGVKWE
ncbi:MAG: PmoA family protein [Candidatus Nealsonbacteria bacterium]|nr:PmoA family protein [Candidatus Nealsonbacteria bacterium]